MMRVAFFSDALAGRYGFGVGRYAWGLFHALQELNPKLDLLPVSARSNLDQESLKHLHERYGHQMLPWGRRWTALAWTLLGWPYIERWMDQDVDLVHHLELPYPIGTRRPWMVTIHDIGPLTHPEYFSEGRPWLMRAALRQAARKAEALVCVSEATAREVRSYLGTSLDDKLFVVPEGVAPVFLSEASEACHNPLGGRLNNDTSFILSAGSINPRKNLPRIIEALEMLQAQVPHHLVLTGARGWQSGGAWERIQASSAAERIHFLGFVTDQELKALYHKADAFIYPSLFEGFGLPVLEAMACGCPVVTSNISSLPEVAGDAALLVDPTDCEALANAILRVVRDQDLAEDLRQRGRKRSHLFTWRRCAERTAAIYEDIVGGGIA
jgi:glycosyltransferase involved in cell wall biosynthesis